jgi:hypothetical protein
VSFKLLTLGNTKTAKGEGKGYMTFIMHLAPSDLSGYNTCPMASAGCRGACLNTAGRGRFTATQDARIRKTRMFFEQRDAFMTLLVKDIQAAIRKANREGFTPVFRLNGTSDIRWETITLPESLGPQNKLANVYPNVMAMFPDVQFYDYTKLPNRRKLPANYHLTFSKSESNGLEVVRMAQSGMSVAVVFDTPKGKPLPGTWMNRQVIDGDLDDLRFLDPKAVIVGLRGKGLAKKGEHNGFVVLTSNLTGAK